MSVGRSIRLYLVDGTPTGIITADIPTWTGRVVAGPRTQIKEFISRPEVKTCGVYILTGPNPEDLDRPLVYVGQSNNVDRRLAEHVGKDGKDFWTRAIVLSYKDDNLTEAHARYLEGRFISDARRSGRVVLTNSKYPVYENLPEPDTADMKHFVEQAAIVMPMLGIDMLLEKPGTVPSSSEVDAVVNPTFEIVAVGTSAKMKILDGSFVVQKGSTARKAGTPSWVKTYAKLARDKLITMGKLVQSKSDETLYVFSEDVEFETPTGAAEAVVARSENGREAWKVIGTGQAYADWEQQQIQGVDL